VSLAALQAQRDKELENREVSAGELYKAAQSSTEKPYLAKKLYEAVQSIENTYGSIVPLFSKVIHHKGKLKTDKKRLNNYIKMYLQELQRINKFLIRAEKVLIDARTPKQKEELLSINKERGHRLFDKADFVLKLHGDIFRFITDIGKCLQSLDSGFDNARNLNIRFNMSYPESQFPITTWSSFSNYIYYLEKVTREAKPILSRQDFPLLYKVNIFAGTMTRKIQSRKDIKLKDILTGIMVHPANCLIITAKFFQSSPVGANYEIDVDRLKPFADKEELFEAVYGVILNKVGRHYKAGKDIKAVVADIRYWRGEYGKLDDLPSEFLIRIFKTMVYDEADMCSCSRKVFNLLSRHRVRKSLKDKVEEIINVFKLHPQFSEKFKSQMGSEEVKKWLSVPENHENVIFWIKEWLSDSLGEDVKEIEKMFDKVKKHLVTHALKEYGPWRAVFLTYVMQVVKRVVSEENKRKARQGSFESKAKAKEKVSLSKPKLKDLTLDDEGKIGGVGLKEFMLNSYKGDDKGDVENLKESFRVVYVMHEMGYGSGDIREVIARNIGRAEVSRLVRAARRALLIMRYGKEDGRYIFKIEKAWNKAMQEAKRNVWRRLKGKTRLMWTVRNELLDMLRGKVESEELISNIAREVNPGVRMGAAAGKERGCIIVYSKVVFNSGQISVFSSQKPKFFGCLSGFKNYIREKVAVYVSALQVFDNKSKNFAYLSKTYPNGYCIAEVYLLRSNNRREKIGRNRIWTNEEGEFCQESINKDQSPLERLYEIFVLSDFQGELPTEPLPAVVKGSKANKLGYISLPGGIRLDIRSRFLGSKTETLAKKDEFTGAVFFTYLPDTRELIGKHRVCVVGGEKEVTKLDLPMVQRHAKLRFRRLSPKQESSINVVTPGIEQARGAGKTASSPIESLGINMCAKLKPFANEKELFRAVYEAVLNKVKCYYKEGANIKDVSKDIRYWRSEYGKLEDLSSEFLIRIFKTMVCDDADMRSYSRGLFNLLSRHRFRKSLKDKVNEIINVFKQQSGFKEKFISRMGPKEVQEWMNIPANRKDVVFWIRKWIPDSSNKVIEEMLGKIERHLSDHALVSYEPWRSVFSGYVEHAVAFVINGEAKKKKQQDLEKLKAKVKKEVPLSKPTLKDLSLDDEGKIDGVGVKEFILNSYKGVDREDILELLRIKRLREDLAIVYVMSEMGYTWEDRKEVIGKDIGSAGVSHLFRMAKRSLFIKLYGEKWKKYLKSQKAWKKAMEEAKHNLRRRLQGEAHLPQTARDEFLSMICGRRKAKADKSVREHRGVIIIHAEIMNEGKIQIILGLEYQASDYISGFSDHSDYTGEKAVIYVSELQVIYYDEFGEPVYSSKKYPKGYCLAEVYLVRPDSTRKKIGLKRVWINEKGRFCRKSIEIDCSLTELSYEDFIFSDLERAVPQEPLPRIVKRVNLDKAGYITLPGRIVLYISVKFIGYKVEVSAEKDEFPGAVFFVRLLGILIAKYRICVVGGKKEVTKLSLPLGQKLTKAKRKKILKEAEVAGLKVSSPVAGGFKVNNSPLSVTRRKFKVITPVTIGKRVIRHFNFVPEKTKYVIIKCRNKESRPVGYLVTYSDGKGQALCAGNLERMLVGLGFPVQFISTRYKFPARQEVGRGRLKPLYNAIYRHYLELGIDLAKDFRWLLLKHSNAENKALNDLFGRLYDKDEEYELLEYASLIGTLKAFGFEFKSKIARLATSSPVENKALAKELRKTGQRVENLYKLMLPFTSVGSPPGTRGSSPINCEIGDGRILPVVFDRFSKDIKKGRLFRGQPRYIIQKYFEGEINAEDRKPLIQRFARPLDRKRMRNAVTCLYNLVRDDRDLRSMRFAIGLGPKPLHRRTVDIDKHKQFQTVYVHINAILLVLIGEKLASYKHKAWNPKAAVSAGFLVMLKHACFLLGGAPDAVTIDGHPYRSKEDKAVIDRFLKKLNTLFQQIETYRQELGIDEVEFANIVSLFPPARNYQLEQKRKDWQRELGIKNKKVVKKAMLILVRKDPRNLGRSVEENIKPKLQLLRKVKGLKWEDLANNINDLAAEVSLLLSWSYKVCALIVDVAQELDIEMNTAKDIVRIHQGLKGKFKELDKETPAVVLSKEGVDAMKEELRKVFLIPVGIEVTSRSYRVYELILDTAKELGVEIKGAEDTRTIYNELNLRLIESRGSKTVSLIGEQLKVVKEELKNILLEEGVAPDREKINKNLIAAFEKGRVFPYIFKNVNKITLERFFFIGSAVDVVYGLAGDSIGSEVRAGLTGYLSLPRNKRRFQEAVLFFNGFISRDPVLRSKNYIYAIVLDDELFTRGRVLVHAVKHFEPIISPYPAVFIHINSLFLALIAQKRDKRYRAHTADQLGTVIRHAVFLLDNAPDAVTIDGHPYRNKKEKADIDEFWNKARALAVKMIELNRKLGITDVRTAVFLPESADIDAAKKTFSEELGKTEEEFARMVEIDPGVFNCSGRLEDIKKDNADELAITNEELAYIAGEFSRYLHLIPRHIREKFESLGIKKKRTIAEIIIAYSEIGVRSKEVIEKQMRLLLGIKGIKWEDLEDNIKKLMPELRKLAYLKLEICELIVDVADKEFDIKVKSGWDITNICARLDRRLWQVGTTAAKLICEKNGVEKVTRELRKVLRKERLKKIGFSSPVKNNALARKLRKTGQYIEKPFADIKSLDAALREHLIGEDPAFNGKSARYYYDAIENLNYWRRRQHRLDSLPVSFLIRVLKTRALKKGRLSFLSFMILKTLRDKLDADLRDKFKNILAALDREPGFKGCFVNRMTPRQASSWADSKKEWLISSIRKIAKDRFSEDDIEKFFLKVRKNISDRVDSFQPWLGDFSFFAFWMVRVTLEDERRLAKKRAKEAAKAKAKPVNLPPEKEQDPLLLLLNQMEKFEGKKEMPSLRLRLSTVLRGLIERYEGKDKKEVSKLRDPLKIVHVLDGYYELEVISKALYYMNLARNKFLSRQMISIHRVQGRKKIAVSRHGLDKAKKIDAGNKREAEVSRAQRKKAWCLFRGQGMEEGQEVIEFTGDVCRSGIVAVALSPTPKSNASLMYGFDDYVSEKVIVRIPVWSRENVFKAHVYLKSTRVKIGCRWIWSDSWGFHCRDAAEFSFEKVLCWKWVDSKTKAPFPPNGVELLIREAERGCVVYIPGPKQGVLLPMTEKKYSGMPGIVREERKLMDAAIVSLSCSGKKVAEFSVYIGEDGSRSIVRLDMADKRFYEAARRAQQFFPSTGRCSENKPIGNKQRLWLRLNGQLQGDRRRIRVSVDSVPPIGRIVIALSPKGQDKKNYSLRLKDFCGKGLNITIPAEPHRGKYYLAKIREFKSKKVAASCWIWVDSTGRFHQKDYKKYPDSNSIKWLDWHFSGFKDDLPEKPLRLKAKSEGGNNLIYIYVPGGYLLAVKGICRDNYVLLSAEDRDKDEEKVYGYVYFKEIKLKKVEYFLDDSDKGVIRGTNLGPRKSRLSSPVRRPPKEGGRRSWLERRKGKMQTERIVQMNSRETSDSIIKKIDALPVKKRKAVFNSYIEFFNQVIKGKKKIKGIKEAELVRLACTRDTLVKEVKRRKVWKIGGIVVRRIEKPEKTQSPGENVKKIKIPVELLRGRIIEREVDRLFSKNYFYRRWIKSFFRIFNLQAVWPIKCLPDIGLCGRGLSGTYSVVINNDVDSNSVGAMEMLIAVCGGKVISLAKNGQDKKMISDYCESRKDDIQKVGGGGKVTCVIGDLNSPDKNPGQIIRNIKQLMQEGPYMRGPLTNVIVLRMGVDKNEKLTIIQKARLLVDLHAFPEKGFVYFSCVTAWPLWSHLWAMWIGLELRDLYRQKGYDFLIKERMYPYNKLGREQGCILKLRKLEEPSAAKSSPVKDNQKIIGAWQELPGNSSKVYHPRYQLDCRGTIWPDNIESPISNLKGFYETNLSIKWDDDSEWVIPLGKMSCLQSRFKQSPSFMNVRQNLLADKESLVRLALQKIKADICEKNKNNVLTIKPVINNAEFFNEVLEYEVKVRVVFEAGYLSRI
jgi:hypothetical protein